MRSCSPVGPLAQVLPDQKPCQKSNPGSYRRQEGSERPSPDARLHSFIYGRRGNSAVRGNHHRFVMRVRRECSGNGS